MLTVSLTRKASLFQGVGIDPMQEPLCSREEAEYLVDALDKGKAKKPQQEFSFTVWFAVLRQKVVWGMALTTVINGLGTPALLTYVPQYLVTQLGFDIKSMGWVSGLPFYAGWLGTLVGGCKCRSSLSRFSKTGVSQRCRADLADWMHNVRGWNMVKVRRWSCMIPAAVMAGSLLMLWAGIADVSVGLAIFMLVLANFTGSFSGLYIKNQV